jgi:hypothetical protein
MAGYHIHDMTLILSILRLNISNILNMPVTLQTYFLYVQNSSLCPKIKYPEEFHDFLQSLQQNIGAEPQIGQ